MKKQKTIQWRVKRIPISKIKPTPNNFKLKTEDGLARFNSSVERYGRAGAVIVNKDFTLINGNTNIAKAKELGETMVDASIPDRQLTAREFLEFSAIFDEARAGQVDLLRIKKEIGSTNGFFKAFGLKMDQVVLDNLAELEKADGKIIATKQSLDKPKQVAGPSPLTLLFTAQENQTVMKKAESLYTKYKVDNITDLVYKIFTKVKL